MGALKRVVTAPLRMSGKQAIILIVLLVIFAGAVVACMVVSLALAVMLMTG